MGMISDPLAKDFTPGWKSEQEGARSGSARVTAMSAPSPVTSGAVGRRAVVMFDLSSVARFYHATAARPVPGVGVARTCQGTLTPLAARAIRGAHGPPLRARCA